MYFPWTQAPLRPKHKGTEEPPEWLQHVTFHLEGLSCRHCAARAEEALRGLSGITDAGVRFSSQTAHVHFDRRITDERTIVRQMALRGFWLVPAVGMPRSERAFFDASRLGIVLALLGNLFALVFWKPARTASRLVWVELVFALLLLVAAAPPLVTRAVALARRRIFGGEMIALCTAAASLTLGLSSLAMGGTAIRLTPNFLARFTNRTDGAAILAFEAAGAIVGFALVSLYVHAALLRYAFADIDAAARSRYARVRRVTGRCGDEVVPCAVLSPGERVRIGSGEVAPIDMRIDTAARIATVSGVSVERSSGQLLTRGERLLSHTVTGRVEKMYGADVAEAADQAVERTTLRIARACHTADGRDFDDVASVALSVGGVSFAVFALIVHVLLAGAEVHAGAGLAALSVLVGLSQAGFVMGIPLARTIAVLRARSAGIVIKHPQALDVLAKIDVAHFDKSGTLTAGAPHVVRLSWHGAPEPAILADVAALEATVTHPAGRAIARHLAAICIEPTLLDEPAVVQSNGVSGRVRGAFIEVSAAREDDPQPRGARAGTSVVCIRRDGHVVGSFEVFDPVRPDAPYALRALWHRGIGCRVLSADGAEAVHAVAHRVGATSTANVGHDDKVHAIAAARATGACVLHVGDGRGQAPLAADVAVAITPGALPTDVRAPIVMLDPNLHGLVWLVDLARALHMRTRSLVVIALVYNALVIPLCAAGFVAPSFAAMASLGASLFACIWVSRLLRVPRRSFAQDKHSPRNTTLGRVDISN